MFQELRATDMHELGKLVDALPAAQRSNSGGGTGGGSPDVTSGQPAVGSGSTASGGNAAAAAEIEAVAAAGAAVLATEAAVDEYATGKEAARRPLPDLELWERVLDAMALSDEQLEAYAEVRKKMTYSPMPSCSCQMACTQGRLVSSLVATMAIWTDEALEAHAEVRMACAAGGFCYHS